MTTFTVQMREVEDAGGSRYPLFSGFLTADALDLASEVPAFATSTTHASLAQNIIGSPVENWQRPEIGSKITEIGERYSLPGEIMPNPVLLAAKNGCVRTQLLQTHSDGTQTLEMTLIPPADGTRPLLILDGQHRVRGMSKTTLSAMPPVPFVLLANVGVPVYDDSTFARVFAEVTTKSTELEPLHDEWLKFAFRLDRYRVASGGPDTPAVLAMKAAAHLCTWNPPGPDINVFRDKVQFNPKRDPSPAIGGGFSFDATQIASLVEQGYFANDARTTALTGHQVAEEVSQAVLALSQVISTAQDRSVFFGDAAHKQLPMQYGFLDGCLQYIARHGSPADWTAVLKNLKFNSSNWDFHGWVNKLDGNFGNRSRVTAARVMRDFFTLKQLPSGVADMPRHLQGDGANFILETRPLGPGGRALRAGSATRHPITVGRLGTVPDLTSQTKLYLSDQSNNLAKLEIVNLAAPYDDTYSASKLKAGVVTIPPSGAQGTVNLEVKVEYYGGVTQNFKVVLTWQ